MDFIRIIERIVIEIFRKKHNIISNKKIALITKVVEQLPSCEDDEKLVDDLMNKANKGLKSRGLYQKFDI